MIIDISCKVAQSNGGGGWDTPPPKKKKSLYVLVYATTLFWHEKNVLQPKNVLNKIKSSIVYQTWFFFSFQQEWLYQV